MTETASTPNRTRKPRRSRARRAAFGSTRQLPSGRWQARYLDGDGTRHTAPRTFETARDAEDWLATSRADLLRGTWHSPTLGALALAEYAEDWLITRVDLAHSTRAMYRRLLAGWVLAELDHPNGRRTVNLASVHLRDLNPAMVREWHAAAIARGQANGAARAASTDRRRTQRAQHAAREWARTNGFQVSRTGRIPEHVLDAWRSAGEPAAAVLALPPTEPSPDAGRVQVSQAYRVLRAMLTTAHADGLIPANPCTLRGAGQTKARERVPATPEDLHVIAAHMPDRYAAAVHVAAWSGLRAGELFGLTRAHVNLTRGTVRVERALIQVPGEPMRFGMPKTTASLRTVHLPGPVADVLRSHLDAFTAPGPDALVFCEPNGSPLHSTTRTRLFRAACDHAGLPDLRWHDLRHTGATMAAQAGASLRELQARLGHSTIAAAMTYQHATAERDRELASRMSALIAPPTDNATTARTGRAVQHGLRVAR